MRFVPKNFRGHNKTGRFLMQLHISCDKSYIFKGLLEIPELLVGQSLNWRGVDTPEIRDEITMRLDKISRKSHLKVCLKYACMSTKNFSQ